MRYGRQTSQELEWRTAVGAWSSEVKKEMPLGLTFVDKNFKMTPPGGKTRSIWESSSSKEVAIRTPAIRPGIYLKPINEYQLEVEFSKLSGASRWWRQVLKP